MYTDTQTLHLRYNCKKIFYHVKCKHWQQDSDDIMVNIFTLKIQPLINIFNLFLAPSINDIQHQVPSPGHILRFVNLEHNPTNFCSLEQWED